MDVKKLKKPVPTERKMLKMVCGVIFKNRISSSEDAERVDVRWIDEWLRSGLRLLGHVLRRDEDSEVGIDNRSSRGAREGKTSKAMKGYD